MTATLPWIALLALSVNIEFVSSSARVTSVQSADLNAVKEGIGQIEREKGVKWVL